MYKSNHLIAVCVLLLLAVGCQLPGSERGLNASEIDRFTLQAPFIFEGTIFKADGSTMPNLQVGRQTAVVTVDNVLKAPKTLGDYTDRGITLVIRSPVKKGERAVFFTKGFAFGRGLAVRELGRISYAAHKLRDLTVQKIKEIPARLLRAHVRASELVVVGRVEAILSPPPDYEGSFISEHYPYLRGARIKIVSIEKGQYNNQTLVVPFPLSQDVMWWRSPKFKPGQEGLWILHKQNVNSSGNSLFHVAHQSDFLPMQSLNFVREQISFIGGADATKEYIQ